MAIPSATQPLHEFVYLASQSPRRRQLLDQLGVRHELLLAGADESMRLSDLTLPHAFVRVLLAEALYRAWSLAIGHPYHRE